MKKIVKSISFGDKLYKLTYEDDNGDIDIDEYTSIHYDNIVGELLVNSQMMMFAGRLLAEAQEIERSKELKYKVTLAKKEEHYRSKLYKDYKEKKRDKAPIREEIQNSAFIHEDVQRAKRNYHRAISNKDYIYAFHEAIKSKDFKLNKLIDKIAPENHDDNLIEGKLHHYKVQRVNSYFD